MRKLILFLLVFASAKLSAQVYQEMPQYGYRANRMAFDSTLQIPTVCGVPTLKSVVKTNKSGAIAYDSCNAKFYAYNPKTQIWAEVSGGGAGGDFWKTSGTTLLSGNVSIGSDNNITFSGGQTQDIPLFNINANIIQFDGGTYKFKTLSTQTDTTSFKPLGINSDGEIQPLTSWISGGTTIDTTNQFVKRLDRTPGKDSIIYFVGANRFAIKDSVGSNPAPIGYYGAFQDTIIQTLPLANTAYPIKARITDLSNGVFLADSTRFVFNNAGIYNLQWSGQFQNTNIDVQDARIWVKKNNIDIIGTTGLVAIPKRKTLSEYGHTVTGWNFLLEMNAGDTLQFYWAATSTDISLHYYPLGTVPPSPTTASMVVTITQQSGIMAGTGITGLGTSGNLQSGANQTLATSATGTDFTITSASNTQTFNLPIASATSTGKLSSANWTTFNNKLSASDTSVFQRKSLSANTFMANNTSATANATAQYFKDTSGTYTSAIGWNGTAPTSGNLTYRWTRIGKMVTINISLVYANAGSANSTLTVALPSDAPTPSKPAGLTSALNNLYPIIGSVNITNQSTLTNSGTRGFLRNNTANNGFEFNLAYTATTAVNAFITCTYFTD